VTEISLPGANTFIGTQQITQSREASLKPNTNVLHPTNANAPLTTKSVQAPSAPEETLSPTEDYLGRRFSA